MEYPRPSTRGDLRDMLKAGMVCEVATYTAEITKIMLNGWLNFDAFTVEPSSNEGWSLFKPKKETP